MAQDSVLDLLVVVAMNSTPGYHFRRCIQSPSPAIIFRDLEGPVKMYQYFEKSDDANPLLEARDDEPSI